MPADDFTDPAVEHTFGHLSATVVLSRDRAAQGLYPAIDPLRSTSSMLTPAMVGERHDRIAREVRQTLAVYDDLKDIIAMLGLEELSESDQRTVGRARRLERYLTQPFYVTEQFTGQEGEAVALGDALDRLRAHPGRRAGRRARGEAVHDRHPGGGGAVRLLLSVPTDVAARGTGRRRSSPSRPPAASACCRATSTWRPCSCRAC